MQALYKTTGKLPGKWFYWIVLAGLAVSMFVAYAGAREQGIFTPLNYEMLDTFLRYSANGTPVTHTLSVDIDEPSIAALGQWPWPRYRDAVLVQKIAAGKPAAIGLDILFPEPDRTSLNNIRKTYKQDFGVDLAFSGLPRGLSDNDGYFGQVLSDINVVGARYFYFSQFDKAEGAPAPEFRFTGRTDLLRLNDAAGILNNTPEIASQLKYSGFINNRPDSDGLLRRVPLLIRYRGVIYPQLALATFMRAKGVDSADIEKDGNGLLIRTAHHAIPIDDNGYALLNFNGKPYLYPSVSAIKILDGSFPLAGLGGKIVFVGSSAAALGDLHSTLFDSQFPGLALQSVIVENIEANSFIREPAWSKTAVLTASFLTALIMSALFIFLREPWQLFLGTAALAGSLLLASLYLFRAHDVFISPLAPMLLTIILFTLFVAARFAIEKRHAYEWYKKLANAQQVTMQSMAAVAETRDPETGAHIKRTQHYVKSIAERLKDTGYYADILSQGFIDLLFVSAPLHDIGKVGVPDNILLKPSRLTEEEFVLMKKHTEYGKAIINSTAQKIEGDNFLAIACEIAYSHHEKWDGSGYPLGLAGLNIPLSARIMAVADVYDALISRRCYKSAFPHQEAIAIMQSYRGKIFDPIIFDAFCSIEEQIIGIAMKYRDENELVLGDR
ncbi:MAG TPA: CHASE2 domain-containing protein [Burkholderiales bacterium]|nr:CHASE2 domain-containing protein [Burkholderiales bacterium]